MFISALASRTDNDLQSIEASWEELGKYLTEFRRTACTPCPGKDCAFKDGPAWLPVKAKTGAKRERGWITSIEYITAGVFDLDHLYEAELDAIFERVDSAGLAAIVHSTHSHKPPEDCCARLVLPFSRPVLPAEWPRLRVAITEALKLPADPRTADATRIFYCPSAPDGAATVGVIAEGNALSIDTLLANAPATAPALPKLRVVPPQTLYAAATDLDKLKTQLRAVSNPESREIVRRILKGEALAEEGARDDTLNRAVGVCAFSLPPETTNEAMLELLRPSVLAMPGDPPPGESDWLALAAYKLERARDRKIESDDRNKMVVDTLRQTKPTTEKPALALVPDTAPTMPVASSSDEYFATYTSEQIAVWAAEQGTTPEGFSQRWIIQRGDIFWIFVDGIYQPIEKAALELSLQRDFEKLPVKDLCETDKDGNFRLKSTKEFVKTLGTAARYDRASLSLQKSYYDADTQTFHEAVCPIRKIQPVEHPEIQIWLELLGGAQVDKLLDWVATVTDLDKQSCALYFHACSGVGKTLFAHGLARLWNDGAPSELGRVFSSFNDVLAECPLVFADEKLPLIKGITSELRQLLGSTVRNLVRKYRPTCSLDGSIRLIIAANNSRVFDQFGEELDSDDLEAVAGRFLYIRPNPEAKAYIEGVGRDICDTWRSKDKLAEHALWLKQTRKVKSNTRFAVEGETSSFHERLATTGINGAVLEWLGRYLTDKHAAIDPKIMTGEGELWVSTAAFLSESSWRIRVPSVTHMPSTTKIGRILSGMSYRQARVQISTERTVFHCLIVSRLLSWAEEAQIGDMDTLRARINAPNPVIAEIKKKKDWMSTTPDIVVVK